MAAEINPGASTVLTSLFLYGAISVIVLIVFERSKGHKALYAPRLLDERAIKPRRAKRGILSYFISSLVAPEAEVLSIIGFDSFIFLRFIKLFCKSSLICSTSGFLGTHMFS